jgi:hypothetical protein
MYEVYTIILSSILALGLSTFTSYPPNLPIRAIELYDYPIVRLLVLGGIFYIGTIIPDVAILLGIVYAILADDIVKTSSRHVQESFQGSYPMINLLPGVSDVQQANSFADKKVAPLDTIKETIRNLEAQIADLSRSHK